jgi:hypothetical protein
VIETPRRPPGRDEKYARPIEQGSLRGIRQGSLVQFKLIFSDTSKSRRFSDRAVP